MIVKLKTIARATGQSGQATLDIAHIIDKVEGESFIREIENHREDWMEIPEHLLGQTERQNFIYMIKRMDP
jgi:hypothetical protein